MTTTQDCSVVVGPGEGHLALVGEADIAVAPALRRVLHDKIGPGRRIRLDMSGVTFIDSTVLGVLVGTARRCDEVGGDLVLTGLSPGIYQVFEITGLTWQVPSLRVEISLPALE